MAKITSLIGALEGEMPDYADAMKSALKDHRDTRRGQSPDIEGQLTGGKAAKLRADMARETGERVQRVVHRGKRGARTIVQDIVAARAAADAEAAEQAQQLADYHAERSQELAIRNSGAVRTYNPNKDDPYDNRGFGDVLPEADATPLAEGMANEAGEAIDESAESPANEDTAAQKVGRKPRATRDKPTMKPCISRGGRR